MINIKIEPIQQEHINDAREIILNNAFEYQLITSKTRAEAQEVLNSRNELSDLDNVQEVYFNNRGVFLVMLNGPKVIGMGGVKYFDNEICELRRMFFAKEYQGLGLGKLMAQTLIDKAKELGYKKMRLWVYNPETQVAAGALYRKLGFYEIPPYVVCKGKLFMEKTL
jgi:putative acetyltransferase